MKQSIITTAICATMVGMMAMCAHARVADPFYADFNPSWRTANHTRSRITEDRPVMTTLLRTGFDSKDYGDFGKIGFWNYTVSSLSGRRDATHRRPLNEMDYGCFWTYNLNFSCFDESWKEWSITTDIMKDWITLPGFSRSARSKKSNASISEWRFQQNLNNPYVSPYYQVRRGVHPQEWLYIRTGLERKFKITDAVSFSANFFGENGNETLFECRYGKRLQGGRYHTGIMALNLMLELSWKISDALTAYANVHQFDIVNDDARDKVKAGTAHRDRRDLTIGTLGLRFKF